MFEGGAQMSNLRERLASQAQPVPQVLRDDAPSPLVEPPRQHAAATHNRRMELDAIRIHYGTASELSIPYSFLISQNLESPSKLVLEFATWMVTIEGTRLRALMSEIESRQLSFVRANDNPEFDQGGKEANVTKVTVERAK
ncbi:MAG TPA: hypothetical protein VHB79_24145 [Polyangiaceae bacterium]|nr:hypothetical protein [Polyangiaceae bacterium]